MLTKINGRNIKLHRYIMPASEGIQIDHVNRKKYDCWRGNLRYAVNKEIQRPLKTIAAADTKTYIYRMASIE